MASCFFFCLVKRRMNPWPPFSGFGLIGSFVKIIVKLFKIIAKLLHVDFFMHKLSLRSFPSPILRNFYSRSLKNVTPKATGPVPKANAK